jgi:tetratricopeptide (TPR) repeat protein
MYRYTHASKEPRSSCFRKSQIAIEYAYRARDSAPYMWVFWVHASTTARFEQAYGDIADKVGLQGREDPKTNILQLVHNWLRDEMNGRWLMIVDNADDDQVFASPHANNNSNGAHSAQRAVVSLAKFLPQASNGWILVTSRDLAAAMNLVGGKHNVIHIDPMDEHDALTLLKSKMRVDESSEEDAKALVETLEGIPLAITHAAAYITANEPIISVSTYLKLFSESEENQASLLDSEDARDLRRDPGVSDAVITTWQLSFEQIRKTKPEAADLLSLMTMFDRQGIPEYLIYDGKTQLQFTEAVGPLFRFSLIRTQARKEPDHQVGVQLLDMHSLVHLATRAWVKRRGQINMWQKAALRILAATFPDGRPETWAACQILLPHSMKVLGYSVENAHQARLDRAKFASNTAWYLMQMGEYAEAGRFVRSAVKTRKEVLGLEHQDTLTSVGYFGLLLLKQGKYEEAELMLQRALQRREKVLGPEHQDTLRGIQDLGAALKKQGKYKEAEAMHQRALQGQEKVLGPGHVDTLYTVINLGGVLESQGKYKEAEAMHQRALQGCKNMFGLEHPITLSAMASLASTLWNQGQLVNAKKLQIQVLEGYKRVLGDNHPDTLTTMGSLASTLKSQGQLVDAMDLQTQVLDAGRRVLGDNHPDTLLAMDNLAHTLRSQGRNQVALSLTEVCVEGRERVLGLDYINNKSSTAWLNDWRSEDLSSEDLSSEE